MTFFYDLNKKLDEIRATPELTHTQLNERNMSRAAKGWAKFGDGMPVLSQAAKNGASEEEMDAIRKKYNKYDEAVEEGAYQGGPDKSQIPAVNRPGNKLTTADLEKERTQSPTSAEGMRALQDKLSKINPMDEADMEEGNAFSKAVVDAKADGIQPGEKINVGGKEYPIKEAAFKQEYRIFLESKGIKVTDEMLEEGWKEKLAAAGTAAAIGATSLGMMGGLPGQSPSTSSVTKPTEFSQQVQAGQQVHNKAEAMAKVNKQFAQEYYSGINKITTSGFSPKLENQKAIEFTQQLLAKYQANESMLEAKKPVQATESIKLIAVKEGADQTVKVYCDTAYDEFHVRVFSKGQEVVESRYFTESQDDAISTADYMIEGAFTMAPKQKTTEAAKWRDPKYKDKLYTQEPRNYDQYDYGDDDYYNPKPANYPGEKNLKGGGEFDHNDPLQKGQGIGRSGIKHSILDRGPRKGLPSRDQITSLKGSIKSAKGTHAEPNLPEAGLPMVKGPDGKMLPKFAVDGSGPGDLKKSFADKIAGAKKEVDEMLGDVAAEAMKKALGGGMGRSAEMEEKEDLSPFTAHKRPRVDKPKVGSTERGALHDIEHTATGRKVTRRVDPNTGHSVGADDSNPASGNKPKRKAGRPDGQGPGKRIGAKGPSGKSKLMTREGPDDLADQGEYDQEGDMAKDDIKTIVRHAQALSKVLGDNDNLPEWVQSKLAKIEGMMISIDEYMQNQEGDNSEEEPIAEKATSKKQQKFMGMVHAAQKGEKPASGAVAKVAKEMPEKAAKDFASTKHKGLPEKKKPEGKKKEESVEENTVAGSMAPAAGGKAPKGSGGMTFGKGVYEGALAESFNNKLKTVLNEGMSVNMSADQDGKKSLTVTATDEDAVKLSQLLNLAGIGGQSQGYGSVCPGCGSSDCGCDQMQEDLANSADNTVYADTDYMVNGLSGGLDGIKTDQSTLGTVINQDPRRTIGSVAENNIVELYKRIS